MLRFIRAKTTMVCLAAFVAAAASLFIYEKRVQTRDEFPAASSLVVDDCRRRRVPPKPGEFRLGGIWLDHRNGHKVRIKQNGSNRTRTAELTASYVEPLSCPRPASDLTEDFYGDLVNNKLTNTGLFLCDAGAESAAVMPVSCRSKKPVRIGQTDGTPLRGDSKQISCRIDWYICGNVYNKTFVTENHSYACEAFFNGVKADLPKQEFCCDCYPNCRPAGSTDSGKHPHSPQLEMTVAMDERSMSGMYIDPATGNKKKIYLTLETSDAGEYEPMSSGQAKPGAKLYYDSSETSVVKQTLPPGTQLIIEQVVLGPSGDPAWYFVTDNQSVGGTKWYGYVPAGSVGCPGHENSRPPSE